MERIIGPSYNVIKIIEKELEKAGSSLVLGPLLRTEKREKKEENYISHKNNRDLFIHYLQLLSSGSSIFSIILAFETISLYEVYIIDIAIEKGTYLTILSPNATPVDKQLPKMTTINDVDDFLSSAKGKTLVLLPQHDIPSLNPKNRKIVRVPQKGGDYIVATSTITNKIASTFYDNVIVYGLVEKNIYVEGAPLIITLVPRSVPEYSVLRRLGKNIFQYKPQLRSNNLIVNETPIHDITVHLRRYGDHSLKFLIKEDALESLLLLEVADVHGFPTDIGKTIYEYTENTYANLFLHLWKKQEAAEFIFPGCVITSFLSILPSLRYNKGETTFEQYLHIWHDMVESVSEKVLDSREIIKWCTENNIDPYVVGNVIHRINFLVKEVGIVSYGRFTVEGAVTKSLPLFNSIYRFFRAKVSENDTYKLSGGETFSAKDITRSRIAILAVRNNIVEISLPM